MKIQNYTHKQHTHLTWYDDDDENDNDDGKIQTHSSQSVFKLK